jgi:hypothetical protein
MILSLSTITHYLSIIPILKYYYNNTLLYRYTNIIIISSSTSLFLHTFNEPKDILYHIDYLCAVIWGIFDILLAHRTKNKIIITKIILFNFIVLITNLMIDSHKSDKDKYVLLHSCWHILSSIKCYYVSGLFVPFRTLRTFGRAEFIKHNTISSV